MYTYGDAIAKIIEKKRKKEEEEEETCTCNLTPTFGKEEGK
jgi:hypothetical protein